MVSKPKKKPAGGRPTKFKPEFVKLVKDYTELGATIDQIARFLGVDQLTIHRWMDSKPEFCKAIKETKELADYKVEKSLYTRAMGFVKKSKRIDGKGDVIELKEEQVPPDTAAAFIWLKNRKPKEWRDKQEIEHSGEVGVTLNIGQYKPRS